jgi:hypothetical protein
VLAGAEDGEGAPREGLMAAVHRRAVYGYHEA